jgi:hypothetical protein
MGMIKYIFHIVFILLFACNASPLLAQKNHQKEYRIDLVLPFKSGGNHSAVGEAMLDYYQGFVMGAQQLESEGFKAKIRVFDSEKDSAALENIISNDELNQASIIIGPVYQGPMEKTASYCQNKSMYLVSPLKYYKPTATNQNIVNFFAPDSIRLKATADKAFKLFPKHRYFIITDANSKSKADALLVKLACKNLGITNVKTLTLTNGRLSSPITRPDSIIIFNTIENAAVKPDLEKIIKNKKRSWIIAHQDWHGNYKTVVNKDEPNILYPEVTIATPGDTLSEAFEDLYYESYYSEPSKYAYIGYDQATFLGYGLMAFGDSFVQQTLNMDYRGFISHILLRQHGNQFLNYGIHFIRISDGLREEVEP